MNRAYLKHYGILGMRWGRRSGRTSTPSADHAQAQVLKKKKVHEMTNDEIKTLSTRMRLETEVKKLNPSKVAKGAKAVDSTIVTIGKTAAAIGTLTAIAAGVKKAVEFSKAYQVDKVAAKTIKNRIKLATG